MTRPTIAFWYEFASTYSFIAAERIDAVAQAAGVAVRWRPFLLGPVFAAQGLTTSPFNVYPVKGRNMWRDVARLAGQLGHQLTIPPVFPANGLLAARIATALDDALRPPFSRAVYRAAFTEARDIGDRAVLEAILRSLGLDPATIMDRAQADAAKTSLRATTEEAMRRGLFGAPSIVTADGELFWGNDRLEDALAWAKGERWNVGDGAPWG